MSKVRYYCCDDGDLNKQLGSIIAYYNMGFYLDITSENKTIPLRTSFRVDYLIDTKKLEVIVEAPNYVDVYPYADNVMFIEFVNGLKKQLLMDILTG